MGAAAKELVQQALPGMAHFCDTPERSAGIFLRTSAEVFSRWYLALKGAMSREKARQAAYREENNLKKKARVQPMSLLPNEAEYAVSYTSEAVIRSMFGDKPADYARIMFECAVRKGDMRSFKIRLLMLKARDSLPKMLRDEFAKWAPYYITEAERIAGCKPCPGPRRMSKAERERKKRREEAKRANLECSLFNQDFSAVQDIEEAQEQKSKTCSISVKEALSSPIREGLPSMSAVISSISEVLGENTIEDIAKTIKSTEETQNNSDIQSDSSVTVTDYDSSSSVTVTGINDSSGSDSSFPNEQEVCAPNPHVGRKYNSASEIIEDIESGKIIPYGSAGEIVSDMKAGRISPSEAMMFISAIDIMSRKSGVSKKRRNTKREDLDIDGFTEEEDIDNEEDEEDRECEGGFSYNPDGFGGEDIGDDFE